MRAAQTVVRSISASGCETFQCGRPALPGSVHSRQLLIGCLQTGATVVETYAGLGARVAVRESAAETCGGEEGAPLSGDATQLAEILDKCLNAVLVHRDGRPLYINKAYARLHGYASLADAVARHRVGITNVHPDDRSIVAARVAARIRGDETTSHYEFRLIRQDGGVIWVECLASKISWSGQPALLGVYHDVSGRKHAEEALWRSERLFSTVFRNSPDIMLLSTLDEGRILDVNQPFLRARGFEREEVIGRTGLELGLWESPEARMAVVEQLRRAERVIDMPSQLVLPDGEIRELSVSAELLCVNGEELILYVSRDVTERRRAEARIAHLAQHDPLTGLANRTHFLERPSAALASARRRNGKVAALAVDLDRFKEVNDTLGHPAGDALLYAVAERLRGQLRCHDVAGRLGGDEFAVLQAEVTQPMEALALAARLVEVLGEPYDLSNGKVQCGASIGVALFPVDGVTPEHLMRRADIALYQAKGDGRGSFRFFDPGMEEGLRARRALEQDLRCAVRDAAFALSYQPLFTIPDRRIYGFEALLRWDHPERGFVPPADFIPIAEETGLSSRDRGMGVA